MYSWKVSRNAFWGRFGAFLIYRGLGVYGHGPCLHPHNVFQPIGRLPGAGKPFPTQHFQNAVDKLVSGPWEPIPRPVRGRLVLTKFGPLTHHEHFMHHNTGLDHVADTLSTRCLQTLIGHTSTSAHPTSITQLVL